MYETIHLQNAKERQETSPLYSNGPIDLRPTIEEPVPYLGEQLKIR